MVAQLSLLGGRVLCGALYPTKASTRQAPSLPILYLSSTTKNLSTVMLDLPPALLVQIIEWVGTHEPSYQPPKNIAHVCLVNRKLNDIATPILYRNIARELPYYGIEHGRSIFYRCLSTLQTRPQHRSYIKSLQDIPQPGAASQEKSSLAVKASAIPAYHGTVPDSLIGTLADELELNSEGLRTRHAQGEDLWLTLCALLAPNVEEIKTLLRGRHALQNPVNLLLEHIAKAAIGQPIGEVHTFSKLHTLHLETVYPLRLPVKYTFPLLLLPKLEHLILGSWGGTYNGETYIYDPNDTTVFSQPWTWPLRSSPITSLSFRSPLAKGSIVCNMIRACTSLLKFECTNIASISVEGCEDWYSPIAEALQDHRHTLREIKIGEEFNPILLPSVFGWLHSLQHMSSLTTLRIPWRILMGFDGSVTLHGALPQSIEEVTIELYDIPDENLEKAFTQLHEECAIGKFPQLKRVHLLWRLETMPLTFSFDVEKVRNVYATGHVCFDITVHCSGMMSEYPKFLLRYSERCTDATNRASAPSLTAI
jgi:hypothetical protein